MKARLLKHLLNDTKYTVADFDDCIGVGSSLCHDLIKLNKGTMAISYALDTFRDGRKCLMGRDDGHLLFIWDKLQELVDSGEIQEIINGNDEIENPIPVFYGNHDHEIIEAYTDKLGWPNTTHDGKLMYDNTHFASRVVAIQRELKDAQIGSKNISETIEELKEKLDRLMSRKQVHDSAVGRFEKILEDKYPMIAEMTLSDGDHCMYRHFLWSETVDVFNIKSNETESVLVSEISLYYHELVLDEKRYYITHMLSKSAGEDK
jgi:hypothetical protein